MISLTPRDQSLENMYRALEVYRRFCPNDTLRYLEMFLMVATRGPIGPSAVSEVLGIAKSFASEGLDNLGAGSRHYPKSFGAPPNLVSKIAHPEDNRHKLAALSPRGSQLVAEMRKALRQRA